MAEYRPLPFQKLGALADSHQVSAPPAAAETPYKAQNVSKLLITVEEAAASLSVGRPKMWQLVMTGEVPSIKIGASRRIPVSVLEGYVQQKLAAAEEERARR
ncbi:MAG: helix-turn-helix domain-containing protein [Ktedonobacterales bacterium]